MPEVLLDVVKILGIVILVLVVLELLALPDWIGRKLRGTMGRADVEERIRSIESRLKEIEERLPR